MYQGGVLDPGVGRICAGTVLSDGYYVAEEQASCVIFAKMPTAVTSRALLR